MAVTPKPQAARDRVSGFTRSNGAAAIANQKLTANPVENPETFSPKR